MVRKLVAFVAVTVIAGILSAQTVPNVIDVQGFIRTTSGEPVNKVVSLKINLWDQPLMGKQLYTETMQVPVTNGRFIAHLGATQPLPADLFTANAAIFVGIQVDGAAELPRQQLVSVPYALKAQRAATAASADQASKLDCQGCVSSVNLGQGVVTTDRLANGAVSAEKIGITCATGEVLKRNADGWGCGPDEGTTYTGKDFALSNQS